MPDASPASVVRYRVEHDTEYRYATSVDDAWQLAHLQPRATDWQSVSEHRLEIEPDPTELRQDRDFFGNPVVRFALARSHDRLLVRAVSVVSVRPRAEPDAAGSPPWEQVRQAGVDATPQLRFELSPFVAPSALAPVLAGAAALARTEFRPGRPWLASLLGLVERIHRDFEFDPEATTVSTPVGQVIVERKGRLPGLRAPDGRCLRSVGLPARYVSGYLLTRPPPGRPKLAGADASHAWVSAWCPGAGWVDVDPTNGMLADTEFVTLGWGRDFGDVTPLRGVVRGGGEQELDVRVTVDPLPPTIDKWQ